MKLISPAISRLARLRYNRMEEWMNDPLATQRQVLQDLITHGQYTCFGRKHGFHDIFNIRTFKENIPISEYDDLKDYIGRLMQGEENMLWNTPVKWFAKSSGTTSDRSKFIPLPKKAWKTMPLPGSERCTTAILQLISRQRSAYR